MYKKCDDRSLRNLWAKELHYVYYHQYSLIEKLNLNFILEIFNLTKLFLVKKYIHR